MKQIDTIRAALEMATGGRPSNIAAAQEALAALAELERAEPVAWVIGKPTHGHEIGRYLAWNAGHVPHSVGSAAEPLYAAPPAPVAEIREVEVTDAVARKVFNAWIDARWRLNEGQDVKYGHAMIAAVRSELGPALGLVELKEPTPEECERIYKHWEQKATGARPLCQSGMDMFDACRAVLWPKEGL